MRFKGELEDLEEAKRIGAKWGYGNCIQYLKLAWADMLVKEWNLSREAAALAAGMNEYEVKAFCNRKEPVCPTQ